MQDIKIIEASSELFKEISFILSSQIRLMILQEISENKNIRELKEKTKISKSYLNKCLSQLKEKGFVFIREDEAKLTPYGSLIMNEINAFLNNIRNIFLAKNLFGSNISMPTNLLAKIIMLKDSEIREIPETEIYYFSEFYSKELKRSKKIKAIFPAFPVSINKIFEKEEGEIIINKEHRNLIHKENFKLYLIRDRNMPLLSIFDNSTSICFCDKGKVSRLILCKDKEAIKWCNELFEHYKRASLRIN